MGNLDWISQSAKKLKDVESQIGEETKDVYEVYQRNVVLEREIAQRTEELRLANQTLLTLEQVWDMMNSSRPLSSVLETIVSSLYGEFGYIYSFIAQKEYDEQGSYYALKTYLENDFALGLAKLTDSNVFDFKLNPIENGTIENSIKEKEISYYVSLKSFIEENVPKADQEKAEKFVQDNEVKTIIIFPISVYNQFSGFLSVFSPRKELKDDELSFLNLFARQIELAITIANLFETVKKQAVTDHLTNLFNRRFFEDALHREATRSLRTKQPFCLIGLDLDHLKKINDTYGHSMGDKAIATIASVINKTSRSVDVPSRYGGEEFFIILPGINAQGGVAAAERLRTSIEQAEVEGLPEGITASLGVASFIEQTTNIDELFEMCDKAMYSSKQKGRNQVTLADTDNKVLAVRFSPFNCQLCGFVSSIDIVESGKTKVVTGLPEKLNAEFAKLIVMPLIVGDASLGVEMTADGGFYDVKFVKVIGTAATPEPPEEDEEDQKEEEGGEEEVGEPGKASMESEKAKQANTASVTPTTAATKKVEEDQSSAVQTQSTPTAKETNTPQVAKAVVTPTSSTATTTSAQTSNKKKEKSKENTAAKQQQQTTSTSSEN